MSLMEHAVRAVQRGWHVFPCNPCGTLDPESGAVIDKVGLLIRPDRPWKIRWSQVATNDLNQVVAWWTAHPQANIGVAAAPSGLSIVDCDMHMTPKGLAGTTWEHLHQKYGSVVGGDDVLRAMCERYGGDWKQLTGTYTVTTGSGGAHYYLRWPDGLKASQSSPVPDYVDVRCNGGTSGGYVLGAGSVTAKGGYVADNDLPVADAPPWLIEIIREKPKPPPVPRVIVQPGSIQQPGRTGSGSGNYDGLVNAVLYASPGNVNATTHWAACVMAEDDAPVQLAEELLAPAYVAANGRGGHSQAVQTIRSGFRKVKGG